MITNSEKLGKFNYIFILKGESIVDIQAPQRTEDYEDLTPEEKARRDAQRQQQNQANLAYKKCFVEQASPEQILDYCQNLNIWNTRKHPERAEYLLDIKALIKKAGKLDLILSEFALKGSGMYSKIAYLLI